MIYRMSNASEQLIDEILVMDCQSGSSKAMEILVSRWQKRLWRHAYRLTSDSEAAWDVTQQSWLGIIKGIRKLNDAANFKAWAYRITTNKSTDWIRKAKAARLIKVEDIQNCQHEEEAETGIKELLDKLDVKKRVVLSLYYFEQLSIPEIGTALNIPAGTVKSRLHKARNKLKEIWQRDCR